MCQEAPSPYGLCIHGGIDGFSRLLLWLSVYKTNNDPKVVVGHYMESAETAEKCPKTALSGMGRAQQINAWTYSITLCQEATSPDCRNGSPALTVSLWHRNNSRKK